MSERKYKKFKTCGFHSIMGDIADIENCEDCVIEVNDNTIEITSIEKEQREKIKERVQLIEYKNSYIVIDIDLERPIDIFRSTIKEQAENYLNGYRRALLSEWQKRQREARPFNALVRRLSEVEEMPCGELNDYAHDEFLKCIEGTERSMFDEDNFENYRVGFYSGISWIEQRLKQVLIRMD